MSAADVLLIISVIWFICTLNVAYIMKKQKLKKTDILKVRAMLLAFFVAFSVVVISIIVSKL